MTREQALEIALRLFVIAATRSGEHRITQAEVEMAQAALALPPDGVNAEMLAALEAITDHFADVMNGPIMSGIVKFANGVEGIPTIKAARAAIARATHIPMPSKTFNPPAQA